MTNTLPAESSPPSWYPFPSFAAADGSWFAVPPELRAAYAAQAATIPAAAARAFRPGPESGWRDASALPGELPPGVTVAEQVTAIRPPGDLRAYDPDTKPRRWVRLSWVDSDAGLAAWHHLLTLAQLRAAAEAAEEAARRPDPVAQLVAQCVCGVSVPRQGSAQLGAQHLCASCAEVAAVVLPTVRAREVLPDGRSRWQAVEDAALAAGAAALTVPAPVDMSQLVEAVMPSPFDHEARAAAAQAEAERAAHEARSRAARLR